MLFQPLSPDAEPTLSALHSYAQAAIAVNRAHGIAHPKWWHVSLKVRAHGLISDPVPLPGGGLLTVGLDLTRHVVAMRTNTGVVEEFPMREGSSGSAMGARIIGAAEGLGLAGPFDHSKFDSDDEHSYDADHAQSYLGVIADAYALFERHRATLGDSVGPVQLWPHGFDLAFEWFGTRRERYQGEELPSQVNLGLYLRDRPYFYSNPWPFDPAITSIALPGGAEWHTDGWEGSQLFYDSVAGDPLGPSRVEAFAKAVHAAALPYLAV